MTRYVIDSWAWIEYLDGTPAGEKVKRYVEDEGNELFTLSVTLAEIVSKYVRRKKNPQEAINALTMLSKLEPIDAELASLAGELHAKMKEIMNDFGLADAFLLAFARKLNIKVISGDPHFKREKETIFIE